ncbi:MAG: hypothetical protein ACP5GU_01570 [Thermoprotei archaeon]|jgi:hypothetical protein
MSSIEDTFLQAKLEFDLYLVKVKIIKPTCKLEYGGISINSANPGEVIEVPRIIADTLLKDGYCELAQPEITLDVLNKIVFAEEKTKELKKLDPYFYQKTKWMLSLMEKGYIKSSEHDIKRYKQLLTDLEERRLRKILTLIPLKEVPQITDKLTVEERIFYDKLVKIINRWRINLMNDGELDG